MTDIEKDLANLRGQVRGLGTVLAALVQSLPDRGAFEELLRASAELARAHALPEDGDESEFLLQGLEQVLESFELACDVLAGRASPPLS